MKRSKKALYKESLNQGLLMPRYSQDELNDMFNNPIPFDDNNHELDHQVALDSIKKIALKPKKKPATPMIDPMGKFAKSKCLIYLQENLKYLQELSDNTDEIIARLESENLDTKSTIKMIEDANAT